MGHDDEASLSSTIVEVAQYYRSQLAKWQIAIDSEDLLRPWGGFLAISTADTERFVRTYFEASSSSIDAVIGGQHLSPKLLFVEPGKRLSWQFHERRSELWSIIRGPVQIQKGTNNEVETSQIVDSAEIISIGRTERHRLIGLNQWAVIAEIWIHSDRTNPSDEGDIVRVADDFHRA